MVVGSIPTLGVRVKVLFFQILIVTIIFQILPSYFIVIETKVRATKDFFTFFYQGEKGILLI